MQRICFYCGSAPGARREYAQAARGAGTRCAERGMGVVYGGARVGLMGAVADAALAAGGEVVGVMPHGLIAREVAHQGLTRLIAVDGMHTRKQKMLDLADAVVALPGGMGTLDELAEALTWLQLGLHSKPVGLLNVAGFFDPLCRFLEHMRTERFLRAESLAMLHVEADFETLLDRFAAFRPALLEDWPLRETLEVDSPH